MDAHAILTKQGWRGTGNTLHPTTNFIGLSKPILIGRKHDKKGIGKKKHQTSDMWWMQAFDESLKSLNTECDGTAVEVSTSGGLDIVRRGAGKWVLANGGLYANFVKGDSLAGTLLPVVDQENAISHEKRSVCDLSKSRKKEKRKCALDIQMVKKHHVKLDVSSSEKSSKLDKSKAERETRRAARRLLRKKSKIRPKSLIIEENIRS